MDTTKALPLATTAKFVVDVLGAVVIVDPSLAKVSDGAVWE